MSRKDMLFEGFLVTKILFSFLQISAFYTVRRLPIATELGNEAINVPKEVKMTFTYLLIGT